MLSDLESLTVLIAEDSAADRLLLSTIVRRQGHHVITAADGAEAVEIYTEQRPHLVLMDELFKGTNVHDAYECTRAVIDGLVQKEGHLMILSTHLYEVAQHFKDNPSIQFAYFVTQATQDGHFKFKYELRDGISNDRIGYKILEREGVIALLNSKPNK